MTIGNDTQDFRITRTNEYGDSYKFGSYWSRVWSGGDDILTTGPTNVFAGYSERQAQALDEAIDGKFKYTNSGKLKLIRRVWVRKPKRARRGEHAYDMTLISYLNPVVSVKIPGLVGNRTTSFQNAFGSGVVLQQQWGANDQIALLGKLREKVVGSSFNAAVCMAEGKQSLQLIASIAKRLDKTLRLVSKGNFAGASRALAAHENTSVKKTVARNWLELQYGIKPLLNDVFDAAQSLAHFSSVPLQKVITVTRKVNGNAGSNTANISFKNIEGFTAVKIKAIIKEVNVISLIGLTDPASVAWEKLPYSFVADWFIPVGNFLAARGLAQSMTGLFVTTRTVRTSCSGPSLTTSALNQGYRIIGDGASSYRYRTVSVTRTVSTALSVPLPEVKPLNKWFSWLHTANAVSLFVAAHGSKKSRG